MFEDVWIIEYCLYHSVHPTRRIWQERAKKNVIISPFVPCFGRSEDWEREREREREGAPYFVVVPQRPTDPLLQSTGWLAGRIYEVGWLESKCGVLFPPCPLGSHLRMWSPCEGTVGPSRPLDQFWHTKVITTHFSEEKNNFSSLPTPQLGR